MYRRTDTCTPKSPSYFKCRGNCRYYADIPVYNVGLVYYKCIMVVVGDGTGHFIRSFQAGTIHSVYKKPCIHIILQDQTITYAILQWIHRRTYYNGLLLSPCYDPIPEWFCEGNFKHPTFKNWRIRVQSAKCTLK